MYGVGCSRVLTLTSQVRILGTCHCLRPLGQGAPSLVGRIAVLGPSADLPDNYPNRASEHG